MSNYSKLIIFILVLAVISATVLYIDSSMDNINKSMPEISDGIVQGDKDYNEAVDLVNDKYFYDGMDKAVSAEKNYNKSLRGLSEIKDNFTVDIDDVHKEYVNLAYLEVELKLQAVSKLKDAIECFKVEENTTGTNYASQANDCMYQAQQYQNQRDDMVADNPNLFKDNFMFN